MPMQRLETGTCKFLGQAVKIRNVYDLEKAPALFTRYLAKRTPTRLYKYSLFSNQSAAQYLPSS